MTLEQLAEALMFGGIKNKEQLETRIAGHWQYRKNKDFDDVNKAMRMGLKLGAGKTENEIDGIELYLRDVFKKVR